MSYTLTKDEEVKKLPQCNKCKQYATRLDYHVCDKNEAEREAINGVTNWQGYADCGNYN